MSRGARAFWRLLVVGLCIATTGDVLAQEPEELLPFLAQANASSESNSATSRPRQAPGQVLPLQATRHIAFETDEGTWMSVDLSPDGRRLVFDLLGDLYSMDVTGGQAEYQPPSVGRKID